MTGLPLLGAGREADVYALDAHRALRRYRAGGDVRPEAEVMAYLRERGYPVPEVFRAEGPELELARLNGPTLTRAFMNGAGDARWVAGLLAELHRRLHALPARHSTDPADRVLHLDLHPENVVLTADGPVVIDWRNATDGPPALDRAVSTVIIAESAVDPTSPLAGPARAVLPAYLAESGPPAMLDEAAARRGRGGTVDVETLRRAVALIRTVADRP
ncbi:phosphotransferase [Micromonospora sp. NPDC000089]|uniref:phosphotransferase n=1 Tax=unclassified Micromonospora TaxID=2617518 RepID=UPI0036C0A12C